jgi:hypothetical protein
MEGSRACDARPNGWAGPAGMNLGLVLAPALVLAATLFRGPGMGGGSLVHARPHHVVGFKR